MDAGPCVCFPGRGRGVPPCRSPGRSGRLDSRSLRSWESTDVPRNHERPAKRMSWALSSVGRAPARQAGGHWFEPSSAHSRRTPLRRGFLFLGERAWPHDGRLERSEAEGTRRSQADQDRGSAIQGRRGPRLLLPGRLLRRLHGLEVAAARSDAVAAALLAPDTFFVRARTGDREEVVRCHGV